MTYDPTPELDRKLALCKNRIPPDTDTAVIFVTNTLELAWCAARQVFGEKATSQHAFEIFDRIETQIFRIERRRNPRVRMRRAHVETEQ